MVPYNPLGVKQPKVSSATQVAKNVLNHLAMLSTWAMQKSGALLPPLW